MTDDAPRRRGLSPLDVEPLLAALAADESEVREAALAALVRLPLRPDAWRVSAPVVLDVLDRGEGPARVVADLARVPLLPVRRRLLALLELDDPGQRSATAHALARVGEAAGAPILVAELASDDDYVRETAAEALAHCGAGELADGAWDVVRDDPIDDVRFFVALAAARAGVLEPLRRVVDALAQGTVDLRFTWGDPQVAEERLRGLPRLPSSALELVRAAVDERGVVLLEALLPKDSDGEAAAAEPPDDITEAPPPAPAAPPSGAAEGPGDARGAGAEREAPAELEGRTRAAIAAAVRASEDFDERSRAVAALRSELERLDAVSVGRAATALLQEIDPEDLHLGNVLVGLLSEHGPRLRPDVPALFRAYRRLSALHATSLAWQVAWLASRAGTAAVIRAMSEPLRRGAAGERRLASEFVEMAGRYGALAYGPVFGGGGAPPDPPVVGMVEDVSVEMGATRSAARPAPASPAPATPPAAASPEPAARPAPAARAGAGGGAPPDPPSQAPPPPPPEPPDEVGSVRPGGDHDEPEHEADERTGSAATEPEDVYALLDCSEVVPAGVEFELTVGLAPHPSEGVLGGPLTALRDRRNYLLTVHVVADGFSLRDGESWRHVLAVTDEQRHPRATLHLTPDAPRRPFEPRGVQATFTVEGEMAGVAFRALTVVADAAESHRSPGVKQARGLDLTIPVSPVPPDLTVVLFRARDANTLLLTMESPHEGVPLPQEDLPVPIGAEPARFAGDLMREMSALEGKKRMYATLRGKGAQLARLLPAPFWEALRAVHARVGRAPTLLLVSEDPYVPWELAAVDPPLDAGSAPFLSAQTVMGRWVLRNVRLPPPHELDVASMAAVAGHYDLPRWENLKAAIDERESLARDWGAEAVDGTYDAVIGLLRRDPTPSIVHVALHGKHSPGSIEEGLVLTDGEWLSPDVVMGTPIHGRPFVFLNACQVGGASEVLSQYAGMAAAFLVQGASAVVAPLWNIKDDIARTVALSFYERALRGGEGAGEAMRAERAAFKEVAGDPDGPGMSSTLMAYQFFGHPALRLRRPEPHAPPAPPDP